MTGLVVVTGTSSGIGRATAARLLDSGYRVVGISRRDVDGESVGDARGRYAHVVADLSAVDDIPRLVKHVVATHGAPYALVNNAASGADGLLATMHNREIASAVQLDLLSPILLAKYFVRPMLSRRAGRVVTITSIVASTGFRGLSVYSAAKAGLEGFTRSLAREVGPRGVTVNCVAPGFVDTAMTQVLAGPDLERIRRRSPLGRFATLEEVAGAVDYLLSPAASGVTGTVLTVDAGATS